MSKLTEKYMRLKAQVGGSREKTGFEFTFGQPESEANRISPPSRYNRRILAELEYALHVSRANGDAFAGEIEAALEDLQARFDAMDDAGRRAAENGLRRYFPMTDFEVVPGVTTATFNLDLQVAGDGANAIQRYSFHQAGSRWMLINIASNQ